MRTGGVTVVAPSNLSWSYFYSNRIPIRNPDTYKNATGPVQMHGAGYDVWIGRLR